MEDSPSPQLCAVGEEKRTDFQPNQDAKQSYASQLGRQSYVVANANLELCPVTIENGIPTIEFTVEEVNTFTKEEGLQQAVVIKFSYGKPELQELRQILPKQLEVKGNCNIGQLEYRHILVRFHLFEDFANVVSRTSGYVKVKGDEFFFRTFPWTMGFNPREETPKAVVWISFPKLPANFFAKKSLMSIATAVGKPISVDKATKDRTRPSTARVKVLINLLDKHPQKVKIKIVDTKSGKIIEYDQRIVFDNLPKYCTCCNHQGHDVKSCRWNTNELKDQAMQSRHSKDRGNLVKLKGDAREFLNANHDARNKEKVLSGQNNVAGDKIESKDVSDQVEQIVEGPKRFQSAPTVPLTVNDPNVIVVPTEYVAAIDNDNETEQQNMQLQSIDAGRPADFFDKSSTVQKDNSNQVPVNLNADPLNELQNVTDPIDKVGVSLPSISADSIELCKKMSFGTLKVPMDVITEKEITLVNEQQRVQESVALKTADIGDNSISAVLQSAMQNTVNLVANANNAEQCIEDSGTKVAPQSEGINDTFVISTSSDIIYSAANEKANIDKENDISGRREPTVSKQQSLKVCTEKNITVSLPDHPVKQVQQSGDDSESKGAPQSEGVKETFVINTSDPIDSAAEGHEGYTAGKVSDDDQNIGSTRHFSSVEMQIAAEEYLDQIPNRTEELNNSPAQLGTAAGCNIAVPKSISDFESSDNQHQGTGSSRDKKTVRSKSIKKLNSAENNPALPSTNYFDILVNVNEDEGKNVEESRQICHSHNSSHNSEAKNKKQAKNQTSLTIATAKPKLWKDQRDYDDDETWGEGLASISWEEEECTTSEDSDDSFEHKSQRKNSSKNSRATSRHNPNNILNHNAPIFIPRNKTEAISLDGPIVKTAEGVNIRRLPMRNAKKQQTALLVPSKSNRSKNKT